MARERIIHLKIVFNTLLVFVKNHKISIAFANIGTQIESFHNAPYSIKNDMPGIIILVVIRCLCTTLFSDLNLAKGRI